MYDFKTIEKYHKDILNGEISIVDIVKQDLDIIKNKDSVIKAFLEVFYDEAVERAVMLQDKIRKHDQLPPLYGVPIAIKDNILIKNKRATAGSKILEGYKAVYNATVIEKLLNSGAIILGKTNLDEFAMGSSGEFSAFQITKNPYDNNKVPGGSSSGSAAAVSAGMVQIALGSDTGGSIRQPAAFCGISGLKPTYGAVSRYGLIALASSLDQIGPFSKNVEDLARVFSVISGKDKFDSTSIEIKAGDLYKNIKNKINNKHKVKIGIPKEYFVSGISKDVLKSINNVINKFEKDGFEIKEVSLPHTKYAVSVYYIILPAEASANLARFDGIRYSRLNDLKKYNKSLIDLYYDQRGEGFGEEVIRRILLGTFVLSSGYYDEYYSKAQKVRRLILDDFNNVFNLKKENVDVLLTPVTPTTAFKIGEKLNDPLSMYLSDIFTIPVNLAGLPAISLQTGYFDSENMPINFQLIGNHLSEELILSLAYYYQNNLA